MKESPFLTHKEILLSGYGAARTLRNITLSLWNGNNWPVALHRVNGLDERHFGIALELITWYRRYGEDDPHFMDVGRACESMVLEEKRQEEQQKAYEQWERLVNRELVRRGKDDGLAFDNYEWFLPRFEQGLTPDQAAEQAIAHGVT